MKKTKQQQKPKQTKTKQKNPEIPKSTTPYLKEYLIYLFIHWNFY